jgi:hypothetical protein
MSGRRLAGSFWPSAQQELLLKAAFLPDERADAAWEEARRGLDLDTLREGTFGVMTVLYRRLAERVPDEPLLERIKGTYRRTWYANNLLFEGVRPAFAELDAAGAQSLVLDGAGVGPRYYGDIGLRKIPYVELLVRPSQIAAVKDALGAAGFNPHDGRGDDAAPMAFLNDRGQIIVRAATMPLDLVIPNAQPRSADAFWEGAVDVTIAEAAQRTLGPADAVLFACATGATWTWPLPTVQWAVDVLTILKDEPSLDWDRVVRLALERRISLRVHDALRYLAETLKAPIPTASLDRLAAEPATLRERLGHRLSGRRLRYAGGMPKTVAAYARLSSERPAWRAAAAFPDFLRETWGLEHTWQIPGRGVRKAASAVRRGVAGRNAPPGYRTPAGG